MRLGSGIYRDGLYFDTVGQKYGVPVRRQGQAECVLINTRRSQLASCRE
jgi:hypothetical protein